MSAPNGFLALTNRPSTALLYEQGVLCDACGCGQSRALHYLCTGCALRRVWLQSGPSTALHMYRVCFVTPEIALLV